MLSKKSNAITVTVKSSGEHVKKEIDPYNIEFLKPHLFETEIHFVSDKEWILVKESPKKLATLIQEMERKLKS